MNETHKRAGIIGAMDCEVDSIASTLLSAQTDEYAGLSVISGELEGRSVSVVKCGIGKVNAAMCAQILIDKFECDVLINTGIAGAISNELSVGDVVVSLDAVEHDFNAVGVGYPQGVIPDQDVCKYPADENLVNMLRSSDLSAHIDGKVVFGTVASGDIFVSDAKTKQFISQTFNAKCCEMEGAAIAHVAYKNIVPYLIIRSISDSASDDAGDLYENFEQYAALVSKACTLTILKKL